MTPQPEPQSAPIDLQAILWRIRRHRLLPLVPLITVLCGALIYLRVTKPVYESYVVVDMGSPPAVSRALEPLVREEREGGDFRAKVERLNSRIHSPTFLARLVEQLGLSRSPALLQEAKEAVKGLEGITPEEYAMRRATNSISPRITVIPAAQGQMRITVSGGSPRGAQQLASAIADAIIEERKQDAFERLRVRGEFSSNQVAVYQDQLRRAEAALRDFQESLIRRRAASNVVNDDNVAAALGLIQVTDSEIDQIRDRIRVNLGEWQKRFGGNLVVPDLSSARAGDLESRLKTLEIQHGISAIQTTATKDDVGAITTTIGSTRQELLGEYSSLALAALPDQPGFVRDAAAGIALDRSLLRTLQEKRKRLSGLVSDHTRNVQSSPADQMELQRLQSEVSANRDLLLALRRESTSSTLSEALETSRLGLQLDVVEAPQLPLAPVRPNKAKILMIALVLGPILSAGLVLVADRFAAVVQTVEEAERELGIKVIGTVPCVEGWNRPESYLQRHGALLSIVLVVLVTVMLYTLPSGGSPAPSTGSHPTVPAR